MFEPAQGCQRIFNFTSHLGFELRRCGARLRQGNVDGRQINVRQILNWQFMKAHDAGEGQHGEQQDRRNRIADRPGGEIHCGSLAAGTALTTRTTSPSLRKPAPSTTNWSLGVTPLTISISAPCRRPLTTATRVTLLLPSPLSLST